MSTENLTPKERRALMVELKQQEIAERKQREAEIETYKKIACDMVSENFPHLLDLSTAIEATKTMVRENFKAVIDMKTALFDVKEGQQSHQFMNGDGTLRVKIGYNMIDNYDDTVDVGVEKVRQYISSLVSDAKSQILVDTIIKLLSKDSKGTLKASRVLQLQQMADRSGDDAFLDGVRIIRDAYQPKESRSYIRAEWKDGNGAWQSVPLGITEA